METQNLLVLILDDDGNVTTKRTLTWDDLEIEQVDSEERKMGLENCYRLSCLTDEFEIACEVYEYPVGIFNYKSEWRVEPDNIRIEKDNLDYSGLFIEITEDE